MNIDANLGQLFTESLIDDISTITGFSLEVMSQERDESFEEMVGVMSLKGAKNGTLFISANEPDIKMLCAYMIGAFPEEVTEADIRDTLCELVNIVAGSAKLRLSDTDYAFNLSQPFVFTGQNMSIASKDKTRVISRTVGNDELSLKLKVVY
ncbi:MAG: chemotaxis protein CheX [Oscillospiraceae bacterium]|nr:chemotaxis protein CheX [Oscillospiraceae bacterium]